MKYSICRAMTELKTLKARYQKEVSELKLIAVKHGKKLRGIYSSYMEDDFKKQTGESLQSVEAILKRITTIKTEIDKSNTTTVVKIGSREMTVQEALVEKNLIDLKKLLLQQMKRQMAVARREFEAAVDDNNKRVEKMVQDQVSSDKMAKTDVNQASADVLETVEKLYAVNFVDASGLEGKIANLEKEIEEFENNVDYALSESNSTTFIEIGD